MEDSLKVRGGSGAGVSLECDTFLIAKGKSGYSVFALSLLLYPDISHREVAVLG